MSRYYENRPSVYDIKCENGEIDEDAWRDEPVDCGEFYMIGCYNYVNSFPKEWAQSHLEGTGPEFCSNCYDHGSKDGVFLGYCLNCAIYVYNGERGPGLNLVCETEEPENQPYAPGTQKNYNNFPSRNLMLEKDKELEFPEGRRGGCDSDDAGVLPTASEKEDT